jgi:hypothetical protein
MQVVMYKAKNNLLDQGQCPVCGGDAFEWGRIAGQVVYRPGDRLWKLGGSQYIRARRCLQCNNLVQFTDPELTRRQNRILGIVLAVVFLIILLAVMLPLIMASSRF